MLVKTNSQPEVAKTQTSQRLVDHPLLPHMRSVQVIGMLVLLSGLPLLTSCGIMPNEQAEAQSRRPGAGGSRGPTAVDVAIARTGSLRKDTEYTGTTVPWQEVSVRSQVEGKLLRLNVGVGSYVSRGQLVAQLDDTILVTNVTQAEAELASRVSEVARARSQVNSARTQIEQARLEQQQAQNDAVRYQKLVSAGAIPKQQAEVAQTAAGTAAQALRSTIQQVSTEQQAVAAAESRVVAQRAAVAQARERLSYALLTSPITGVVLQQLIQTGNLIQPGTEILKLGDFSRVKVVVQISELELSKIRVGQYVQVRLDAFPKEELQGQIALISPAADPTSRLIPVEITIPNSNGRIGSGLFARVIFSQPTAERLVVPQSALEVNRQRGGGAGRQRAGAQGAGGQGAGRQGAGGAGSRAQGAGAQGAGGADSRQQGAEAQGAGATRGAQTEGTVFVVVGDGREAKVVARPVKLGERANNQVEIISGLKPGERFVSRSGKPIKNGEEVRISIISEGIQPAGNRNAQP